MHTTKIELCLEKIEKGGAQVLIFTAPLAMKLLFNLFCMGLKGAMVLPSNPSSICIHWEPWGKGWEEPEPIKQYT